MSKTTTLMNLSKSKLSFRNFSTEEFAEMLYEHNFELLKIVCLVVLDVLNSPNLNSRKISVTEKSFHLRTVHGRLQNGSSKK